jgi:hypothetical protein
MTGRRLGLALLAVIVLSSLSAAAAAPLGSGDTQGIDHSGVATVDTATHATPATDGAGPVPTAAAPTPSQNVTVAGFNSAFPNCPDQGVAQLGTFFTGDIGPTDSEFHVDGEGGIPNPPGGECFLRTNSESAQITSSPGQQSEDLAYYPERGDEITFQHYINNIGTIAGINFPFSGGSDFEFRFGVQDSQNYYYVLLAANNEPFELRLGKVVNGNRQLLDASSLAISEATFQSVEIQWGTGDSPETIRAEFAGQNVASATDTTFDEGGIGFQRSGTTGDVPFIGNVLSFANFVDRVTATVVPADFQVDVTNVEDTVAPGETAQVTAEITNVGGRDQTESVTLSVGGQTVGTKSVSLDSGYSGNFDSTTVTFDYIVREDDVPTADFEVCATASGNCDTGRLDVLEPASFEVSVAGTTSPVEGEDLSVTAQVTNTGEVADSGAITLDVPGLGSTGTTVSLEGRASTTETLSLATGAGDAGTYTATVSSAGDSASTTVTVTGQASFDVGIATTNSPVEGDPLQVTATVTNTGEVTDTQTITLDVPGLGSASKSVSLSGGTTTTESLFVSTTAGDAGEYTATVTSADDTANAPVAVLTEQQGEGVFVVGIADTNSPVTEGNSLTVTTNVTNTGGAAATQSVSLSVPGVGSDSATLSLDPGESTFQSFSVRTSTGDNGTYTATLETEDDVAATSVQVRAQANFAVNVTDAPTTVAGNDLAVTATVTNTGDISDIQQITLSVPGLGSRSTSASLNGSNSTTVTLGVPTSAGDGGTYTVTVSSADTSDSTPVTVAEPENFAVQITGTTAPVVGGPLAVTAAVTNVGETEGTQTVTLSAQELGTTSTQVSLAPGSATTTTLSLSTGPGDIGSYTATVSTANATTSTPVTVSRAANFAVAIESTNQPVEGEDISVTANVTNTGGVDDTQTVTLDVPGLGTDATTVTLAAGASTTETFTLATSVGDGREYALTVASENETASGSVDVLDLAAFGVAITNATTPVEGEPLSVTANVTNTGDLAGTQQIEVNASGLGTNTTSLSLAPGESVTTTLSVATGSGDAGRYPVRVTSANDTDGRFVTVLGPANFSVALTDANSPVEGETLSVTAEVSNVGGIAGTQTVSLDVPGLGTASASVSLDSNTSTTVALSVGTDDTDAGSYTATVRTDNDTASQSVAVRDQAAFAVDIVETTTPVEGNVLSVTAKVTNTGDVPGTQTVTLDVPDIGTDAATVTLNGSESTTVPLSLATTAGANGSYTATVTTDNASAGQSVTVLADAAFRVSVADAPDVLVGETLTVTTTIANTGDVAATQTVTLAVPGLGTESRMVTLAGSSSKTETFALATGAGDAGDYTVTVSSANSSAEAAVSVLAPASFDVGLTSAPDIVEGEPLSVTAEVTNTGDVVDAQEITLGVPGLGSNTTTRLLGPGNTTTTTLSVPTSSGDAGDYTVTVSTANDSVGQSVSVLAAGSVAVDITNVTERRGGEPLGVNVTVENTGTTRATQEITLDIPGLATASTDVTVDGGESTVEAFTIQTDESDGGEYTATVTSADDSASRSVRVLEEAFLDIEIADRNQPVAGETLNVTVAVTNRGDFSETQFVSISVGSLGFDSATITVDGRESVERTFSFATSAGDAGSYTAAATGGDDSASASVSILTQDIFGVQIDEVTAPVEGDRLAVGVTVKNTGDTQATETVTLDVPGLGTNATTVTLGAGNTVSRTLSLATETGDAGDYTATVSTANDSTSQSVAVLAPATLAVEITGTSQTLTGEALSVTANVTNTGDIRATQTLSLSVPGIGTTTTGVRLDGGTSVSTTLSLATSAGDGGDYTATVSTANDTASTPVTVFAPPTFAVDITDTTDPIVGQPLTVAANVTNVGDVDRTLPVDLNVTGLGTDSADVPLSAGASTTTTFSVPTAPGDAGSYTAAVSSPNATDTAPVSVLAPANLTVEITDTSEPVAGETLSVTATVTNVGDVTATQTLSLSVPGLGTNATAVTLAGSATTTATLTLGTDRADAGNYTATVTTANDTATTPILVPAPANLSVSIASVTNTTAGGPLSVTAEVTNTGDVTGTQTVTFDVPGLGTGTTTLTLAGGTTTTTTLSVGTGAGDAGEYTATVRTANDTASGAVAVRAPANFTVSVTDTGQALAGGTLPVTVEVTNTGDVSGTQTVTLDVPGLGTETTTLTLAGRTTTTATLELALGDGAAGSYTATVTTANDTATVPVTVQEPATFGVTITAASDATEGEPISVTAEVTNTGDRAGTQTVTLGVPGIGTNTTTVSLAANTSTTEAFTLATGAGDGGEYTATVTSANDSASAPVTVVAPASFDVAIADAPAVVAGETLSVAVEVTNTGDRAATQTVTLAVPGLGTASTSVSLGSTTATTATLALATGADDAGDYTATVTSANDTASGSVTVLEPATLAVDITNTTAPLEGESLSVDVRVENTGGVLVTQAVTLDVPGLGTRLTTVTLGAGASTTTTLSLATGDGDGGEYTATVSTLDASDSANVTVLAPAAFDVEVTDAASVVAGANLSVTAEVTNTGDFEDTQTVTLAVPGLGNSSRTVTLAAGAATTETVSFATTAGDIGSYTATVTSANDTASAPTAVLSTAAFDVEIVGTTTPIQGRLLTATVNVTNTGGAAGTRTVSLDGGLLGSNTTAVTLDAGASTTVTLGVPTVTGIFGDYTLTVSTPNSQDSQQATVSLPVIVDGPPTDPDGDGTYEDVRGTDSFSILDVQALFNNLDNPAVVNNAAAFNFQTSFDTVSTLDVQALFNELPD